ARGAGLDVCIDRLRGRGADHVVRATGDRRAVLNLGAREVRRDDVEPDRRAHTGAAAPAAPTAAAGSAGPAAPAGATASTAGAAPAARQLLLRVRGRNVSPDVRGDDRDVPSAGGDDRAARDNRLGLVKNVVECEGAGDTDTRASRDRDRLRRERV